MIPLMNIIAWGNVVPWADLRQVEQDLVISRALVELFSDPGLNRQLRFHGGTALNKLHFSQPLRYSEDIDLVRTETGPIGPILDAVRTTIEPWLGQASFAPSVTAPKLRFRVDAEDTSAGTSIRLKVVINTRETKAFDPRSPYRSQWKTPGSAGRPTSRRSRRRKSSQRNSERSFRETRGATCLILIMGCARSRD